MTPVPAAAVSTPASTHPVSIGDRLDELLERSYRGQGRELATRLLPAPSVAGDSSHDPLDAQFTWLTMPAWLGSSLGLDPTLQTTRGGRALIDDLCWIQYCVYAVFRIQDDLVDGDTDDRSLAVATNPLLVEAARCAARHFDGDSAFWNVFQGAIDGTTRAILTLGKLQRANDRQSRQSEDELRLYAELSASLGIATAGVAIAAGREDAWFRQLRPALDGFWIAAQIVDDLRDIHEDLEAGCLNHAAWFLSHPILGASPEVVEAVIASNLATTDRLELLLEHAGAAMDRGLAALDAALCPRLFECLRDYRRGLPALAARVQRSTVVVLSGSTQNL